MTNCTTCGALFAAQSLRALRAAARQLLGKALCKPVQESALPFHLALRIENQPATGCSLKAATVISQNAASCIAVAAFVILMMGSSSQPGMKTVRYSKVLLTCVSVRWYEARHCTTKTLNAACCRKGGRKTKEYQAQHNIASRCFSMHLQLQA